MRRLLTTLFILAILAIGLSFTALNAVEVEINYYFATLTVPLAVVLFVALVTGALLGLFSLLAYVIGYRTETIRLRKKVEIYEKEIKNLREIPIKGKH